jgi:hypothetical protein
MKKKIIILLVATLFIATTTVGAVNINTNIEKKETNDNSNSFKVTVLKKNGEPAGEGIWVQIKWTKSTENYSRYKEYFGFTESDGTITLNDATPFFDKNIPQDANIKVYVYYGWFRSESKKIEDFEDTTVQLPTDEPKNNWVLNQAIYNFLCMI